VEATDIGDDFPVENPLGARAGDFHSSDFFACVVEYELNQRRTE
jgi:hypothetical protein